MCTVKLYQNSFFIFNFHSNTEAAFRDLLAFTFLQATIKTYFLEFSSMCRSSLFLNFNVQELDLWGGDFYADGLFPIFTQMGPQLTKLNLVSSH